MTLPTGGCPPKANDWVKRVLIREATKEAKDNSEESGEMAEPVHRTTIKDSAKLGMC